MKYLKLFSILVLFIGTFSLFAQNRNDIPKGITVTADDDFVMTITPKTSSTEIEEMKNFLSKYDINLEIEKLEFKDGKISEINGNVKNDNNVFCSFRASGFKKSVVVKGSLKSSSESSMSVNIH